MTAPGGTDPVVSAAAGPGVGAAGGTEAGASTSAGLAPGVTAPGGPQDQAAGRLGGPHPTMALDDMVHQRHRLGILTITAEASSADFGYLRDALGLTPGNLSRHLTVLEEGGLVKVSKGFQGRRPRTWVRITGKGRAALAAEITALTELLRRHGTAGQD